jgi:uncharacterized protein
MDNSFLFFEITLLFFVIAFVYSSVGFGGGSSYIAILALFAFAPATIKVVALLCNIVVVSNGTFLFWKKKELNWKKILPLVIVSVPMTYLGASYKISDKLYFTLLGWSLVVAAVLLFLQKSETTNEEPNIIFSQNLDKKSIASTIFLAAAIGLLSGMVGIGGGIFLSPILNLIRWDSARKIAAAASFFILANSISGIFSQFKNIYTIDFQFLMFLLLAVFIGGQLGSRISLTYFKATWIKRITAVLILVAAIEILSR